MNTRWWTLVVSIGLLAWTTAGADDGLKVSKDMSRTITTEVSPGDVGVITPEAEHAFTDMMKFYVPAQAASGLPLPIEYYNADEVLVETLGVAKPLVNVFIYGPAIGVDGTAFAHSFMDTYAAVSLDDGTTWKKTNLSESADLSSFVLGQSTSTGGGGDIDELPPSHTEVEREDGIIALHAPGMDYPYSNECTECHGATLEGGHHGAPSCYSCHGPVWREDAPEDLLIVFIETAEYDNKLRVEGAVEGGDYRTAVTLINDVTDQILGTEYTEKDGEFEFKLKLDEAPPCTVAVLADGVKSVAVPVVIDSGSDDDGDSDSDDRDTGDTLLACIGEPVDLTDYPGGTYNVFHATAGNKVLVAWPSRYCQTGRPAYALKNDLERRDAIVQFLQTGETADDLAEPPPPLPDFNLEDDLYLNDVFGVAGSQGSIDFADEGYPQAGQVPFGCVWTARGVLLPGDDPRTTETELTHMVWTKAERLTSGRRDPFRIEVKGVKGAGFVITWQEDPDGLRPGQGLGPGEGWSGAVAHSQTDVWYSFINWEYFDYVDNGSGAPINIVNHDLTTSGRPQVFVPMAMPMRLTNNAKCSTDGTVVIDPDPYCTYGDGDPTDGVLDAADFGLKDQCVATVGISTGQEDPDDPSELTQICVSEDGLPNIANTASTRPRLSLQGYDSDADGFVDSAWVIVAAEESKGLGKFFFEPDGTSCEEGSTETCTEEIGKNQWYFSFDMGSPDTSATAAEPYGLVLNLVNQGNMLNQPEVDWRFGEFYPPMNTADMWGFGDGYDFDIENTEIARRASLLVQSIGAAAGSNGRLLATPSWKQGIMRQGGPADTMLRRIVLPTTYGSLGGGIKENPYAFTNMACANWRYRVDLGGTYNPYYPDGICLDSAINLSGVVPDECTDSQLGGQFACPQVDLTAGTFGTTTVNPILRGLVPGEGDTTKVLTWHQCPSSGTQVEGGDFTAVTCGDTDTNLADQSWYNPWDISKGHRGFLDGDMVMFLYAWSPNWRLNAKGSDRYELYVRRSFDGGVSWTTTPNVGAASDGTPFAGDGTVTCETYRSIETGSGGDIVEPHVCFSYPAGQPEQARNVTQHQAMRFTTLDPRYAKTPATITEGCVDVSDPTIDSSIMTCDDLSLRDSEDYDQDLRDASRYFMVFETGDNSTVQVGEAEPLDLFYSQAIDFGDDYVVWADEVLDEDLSECYPSATHDDTTVPAALVGSGFCNEFDRMNSGGGTHSSEANLEANPDGSRLYGVWAQWVFDELGEEVVESNAEARRIWWIDGYIPSDAWDFGQGTGDGVPAN